MPDGGQFRDGWMQITRPQLATVIEKTAQIAPWRVPLFRALGEGRIMLAGVPRGAPDISIGRLKRARLPVVVLIEDDDYLSSGPDGFPGAQRMLRWAHAVILHAAGGEPAHYEAAALIAARHGRAVLIETSSAQAEAWAVACARWAPAALARGFAMVPRGGAHPIAPSEEPMQ